jgi:outer membrane protein OmpA-like peptidoglycan-associated protein
MHANEVALADCTFSCTLLPAQNTFAWTGGGGVDVRVSRHFAIRLVQAEYLMTRFQDYSTGTTATQNDMRLSSGIVFRLGGNATPPLPPPAPLTYSCSVNPPSVFSGEPIAASGTALNLNPARTDVYTWQVDGGTVAGVLSTAKIDTTNLAPGAYTLKCHVSEGDRPDENADATAPYVVKAYEPPTVSCAANPYSVISGDSSTITAAGVSPQNRPLTYSYSSTSGSVSGSGSTATLSTAGAPVGPDTVTCNVVDDKGQTATASASVTVTAPVEPAEVQQLETRLALHSVFFATDQPTIEKSKGGLAVSQEGTLTTLATDFKKYLEFKPDAHLTLTGHADVRGSVEYNQALSERRVTRTKLFLVEQGVPEAKIETLGRGKEDDLTSAQVEEAVKENHELSSAQLEKLLSELPVIVLAKNRRVDITLSTTGQQSVQRYPFNAADALVLLEEKNLTHRKKAAAPVKK